MDCIFMSGFNNKKGGRKMRFFTCEECGIMFECIGGRVFSACNDQKITELIPRTSDGAHEKPGLHR